jgi:dihydroxyacetone kinase-like protein
MEVGIGHHGEPGIRVDTLRPASEMAKMMVDVVVPDLPFSRGDEVAALVSGLGATPVMELYIVYGAVADLLSKAGLRVYRPYVGNYFTSLEMMGVTLTLMKLDPELKELIDMEADCMGLTQLARPAGRA